MFGIKIVSEKKYDALKTELKGFYDDKNTDNQYFGAIDSYL